MSKKLAGLLVVLLLLAVAGYFFTRDNVPAASATATATDEHEDHQDEAPDEGDSFVATPQQAPADGYLCAGVLSVDIPGDEQEFPEAFTIELQPARAEAVVAGLWPSPQFLLEVEPPFWQTEQSNDGNSVLITGIGMTSATSLTSRLTLDMNDLSYGIFWSVLPVGFRKPVEVWNSSGNCEAFGSAG